MKGVTILAAFNKVKHLKYEIKIMDEEQSHMLREPCPLSLSQLQIPVQIGPAPIKLELSHL